METSPIDPTPIDPVRPVPSPARPVDPITDDAPRLSTGNEADSDLPGVVPSQRAAAPPLVPSVPPPGVTRNLRRNSAWRQRLAIVLGIVALLIVAGFGTALLLYHRATAPNRTSPDVSVDNFLRAVLVDQNDDEAKQYMCSNPASLTQLAAFRDMFINNEKKLGGGASFVWGTLPVTPQGNQDSVQADIDVSTSGGRSQPGASSHRWLFSVVNESGWRVCGAQQLS